MEVTPLNEISLNWQVLRTLGLNDCFDGKDKTVGLLSALETFKKIGRPMAHVQQSFAVRVPDVVLLELAANDVKILVGEECSILTQTLDRWVQILVNLRDVSYDTLLTSNKIVLTFEAMGLASFFENYDKKMRRGVFTLESRK